MTTITGTVTTSPKNYEIQGWLIGTFTMNIEGHRQVVSYMDDDLCNKTKESIKKGNIVKCKGEIMINKDLVAILELKSFKVIK